MTRKTGDQVGKVRSFNRVVSRTIGVLNEHYLGRRRPLSEARLLFEIGQDGADVRALRRRMALDSGFLSRLLRSLESQGLIRVERKASDKRVRRITLTPSGMAEVRELNASSDALAQSMLDPLTEKQRSQLIEAMSSVERLLTAATLSIERDALDSPDARYCLGEYAREISKAFEGGFDIDKSLPASPGAFAPPTGLFLIVRQGDRPIGCGGFKALTKDAAYIKRMWISPQARGLGVGRRLLETLEAYAGAQGYRRACLETNRALREAQALYQRCGYSRVAPFNDEPYADYWYEKPLKQIRRRGR